MDHRAVGMPAERIDRRADRLPRVAGFSYVRSRASSTRSCCCSAMTWKTPESLCAELRTEAPRSTLRGNSAKSTGRALDASAFKPVEVTRDDVGRDHLHVRRHGRAQGRRPDASQRAGQHRSGRTGNAEISEIGAAVLPAPVSEPLAAQPHVRPGHGHVRAADAAGTVVFMRGYNPHEIVRQIKKRRISVLVSVPKILDVLGDHVARLDPAVRECARRKKRASRNAGGGIAPFTGCSDSSSGAFVVGAAPLESSLEEFWSRLGFLVVQGYGLTETAPIVTLNHPFSTSKGSVGKADRRRRREDCAGRRNPRARRQRHAPGTTARPKPPARRSRADGFTPAISARWTRQGGSSSAAARKK